MKFFISRLKRSGAEVNSRQWQDVGFICQLCQPPYQITMTPIPRCHLSVQYVKGAAAVWKRCSPADSLCSRWNDCTHRHHTASYINDVMISFWYSAIRGSRYCILVSQWSKFSDLLISWQKSRRGCQICRPTCWLLRCFFFCFFHTTLSQWCLRSFVLARGILGSWQIHVSLCGHKKCSCFDTKISWIYVV